MKYNVEMAPDGMIYQQLRRSVKASSKITVIYYLKNLRGFNVGTTDDRDF
jgi:hypothetical protein